MEYGLGVAIIAINIRKIVDLRISKTSVRHNQCLTLVFVYYIHEEEGLLFHCVMDHFDIVFHHIVVRITIGIFSTD